jgi:large subunit ribosomal protein L23
VYPSATKFTVRAAVEQTFKVSVTRVNIINRKGKPKKSRQGRPITKSDSKRAIVTLKAGDKIELTS